MTLPWSALRAGISTDLGYQLVISTCVFRPQLHRGHKPVDPLPTNCARGKGTREKSMSCVVGLSRDGCSGLELHTAHVQFRAGGSRFIHRSTPDHPPHIARRHRRAVARRILRRWVATAVAVNAVAIGEFGGIERAVGKPLENDFTPSRHPRNPAPRRLLTSTGLRYERR